MPYPNQVSKESIVQRASELIEEAGVDALSLSKLAATLGVKAPSLYRHIGNKNQLLQEVNLLTLQNLFAAMQQAIEQPNDDPNDDPQEQMKALCIAYRRFAHQHAQLYFLAYTHKAEGLRPDEDLLVKMIMPIQILMAQICGDANALTALRGALALMHGFVMLELNEQLQRGGDLEAAYIQSFEAYLRGWT